MVNVQQNERKIILQYGICNCNFLIHFLIQDAAETSRREYNVICVVTGFITVVAMLRETGQ